MLKAIFHAPCGPCSRPRWHPDGRLVWLKVRGGGLVIDVDREQLEERSGAGEWDPDGRMALVEAAGRTRAISWPGGESMEIPVPGRWHWLAPGRIGRAGRESLWEIDLSRPGQARRLARAPGSDRWVWLHGLGPDSWAALRWDQERRMAGLSMRKRPTHPVEHLRLPDLSGHCPRQWSWGSQGQGWALLPREGILAWTFPQGQAWMESNARATRICHVDSGVAWAQGGEVFLWVAASGQTHACQARCARVSGLAWNPARQVLAVAGAAGLDVLQVG